MTGSDPIVDAVGMRCPVPLRLLDDAMRRHPGQRRFVVLADDPLIVVDLPAWCHRRRRRLVSLEESDEGWRGLVERNDPAS